MSMFNEQFHSRFELLLGWGRRRGLGRHCDSFLMEYGHPFTALIGPHRRSPYRAGNRLSSEGPFTCPAIQVYDCVVIDPIKL